MLPPIFAAATAPETKPTASGVKRKSRLSTTGARFSSIPIAATSRRSGSWSAKPRSGAVRTWAVRTACAVDRSQATAAGTARTAPAAPTAKLRRMLATCETPNVRSSAMHPPVSAAPVALPAM